MEIFIENEHLRASFSDRGAELQHITGIDSGTEYLWNGDPTYWGKYSPVLFPLVGALKENSYWFEGNKYTLPRHGFARDMIFAYEKVSEHEVFFTLKSTPETLANYPFHFSLGIRYTLVAASLTCTYEITNPADRDLWFSIGGHPAFAVPLNQEGDYADYYLQFDVDKDLAYYHIENNLITKKTSTLKLSDGKLFLKHELFYDDALVFKTLKSENISLMNTKNYNGINFNFTGFPYFGIWAARNANFVCLEPWCGLADTVDHAQQLVEKEGIIQLPAFETWKRSWQITCF